MPQLRLDSVESEALDALRRRWELLLETYLEDCSADLGERTIRTYRAILVLWVRWAVEQRVDPDSVTKWELRRYAAARKKNGGRRGDGVSAKLGAEEQRCVCRLMRFAQQSHFCKADNLADYRVKSAPRPRVWTPEPGDVRKLLAAVEASWRPSDNPGARFRPQERRTIYMRCHRAMIAVLVATGMRVSEMLSLALTDWRREEGELVIERGKGGKTRVVPVGPTLERHLSDWAKVRPRRGGESLFLNQYGERIKYAGFRRSFAIYRDRAGLPKALTPHGLRHYASTELADRALLMAKEILGHDSVKTTMLYTESRTARYRGYYLDADPLALAEAPEQAREEKPRKRPVF